MNLDDLASLDFDAFETTADWTHLLGELLGLADAANAAKRRGELADALDAYADRSSAPDLDMIARLDRTARKAARALRLAEIEAGIGELKAASAEFEAIAAELDIATAAFRKEAAALRAEQVIAAVSSLDRTIESLQVLAQAAGSGDRETLARTIGEAVASAKTARRLLGES